MDGKIERSPLCVDEGHLDGGLRLEALRSLAIHDGECAMQIEGIAPDERAGETLDGVANDASGDERVARCWIDVAPPLETAVRDDADQHAALYRGRAMHAVHRAPERHIDEHRRDGGDAHGLPSIPLGRECSGLVSLYSPPHPSPSSVGRGLMTPGLLSPSRADDALDPSPRRGMMTPTSLCPVAEGRVRGLRGEEAPRALTLPW